jgi:hypothetical protein
MTDPIFSRFRTVSRRTEWTADEIAKAIDGRNAGKSSVEIAAEIPGKSPSAIRRKLAHLKKGAA